LEQQDILLPLASREQAPTEREDDMASDLNQLPRVLIVDDSRMVRATLIKHIRSHYDYREEGDGEAAWQVVVLDHAIQAIICDLSMPVLDGFGLLARIRNSRLARIRQLPVIMISGDEDEASRERAKALGVSDFIMKGAGATEVLSRLESLIRLTHTERELEKNKDQQVQDPDTGLFTRKYIELQAAQALSHASRHNSEVSVMLLGFDRFDGLRVDAYKEFHQYSIEKPDEFWTEQAQLIDWKEPFTQVCDYSRPPFAKWFVGGKTNLCHNAVDRHAAKRPNDRALIFISTETDEEKVYTFAELQREVERMAAIYRASASSAATAS
jgi:CheY-like chemotaxis protein